MTTLSIWDPARELLSMRQEMDRFFNNWPSTRGTTMGTHFLPMDVYTTEHEVVLIASLPGLTTDDVEIVYEQNALTIRGEFKPPVGNVQWAVQERPYGKFSRTVALNIPIDANKAEAVFENGVLTLTLPKAEWAKPRQIAVKAQQKLNAGQEQPEVSHN